MLVSAQKQSNGKNLLVFHVDKVKCAVKDCIEKIREAETEDEDVGDASHLGVSWKLNKIFNGTRYSLDKMVFAIGTA